MVATRAVTRDRGAYIGSGEAVSRAWRANLAPGLEQAGRLGFRGHGLLVGELLARPAPAVASIAAVIPAVGQPRDQCGDERGNDQVGDNLAIHALLPSLGGGLTSADQRGG